MNNQNDKPWLGKSQFFFLASKVYFCSTFHKGYCLLIYFPKKNSTLSISASFWFTGTFNKRREKRETEEKEEKKEEEMHCLKYFPLKLLDEM